MPWPGWENYTPPTGDAGSNPGRHNKFRARPVLVTTDDEVLDGEAIELVARARNVPTSTTKRNRKGEVITARRPLVAMAADLGIRGTWFASRKEATAWVALRRRERDGEIQNLRRQVAYPLVVGEAVIGRYVADFEFTENGARVVEDVKGMRTELYLWKSRHFAAQFGYPIRET